MRQEQSHTQYLLDKEWDNALREEETMDEHLRDLTVSIVAECDNVIECDNCYRTDVTPLYDNPHAVLLPMYLIEEEGIPDSYLYSCEDCLETVLEEW